MRILIIGAGGHGQVVADILMRMRDVCGVVSPVGFLDDNEELGGKLVFGLPVFRGVRTGIEKADHDAVIIAIGENRLRREIFMELKEQRRCFALAKHPCAIVASGVLVGEGSMICAGAIINPQSKIGANVILNTGCIIDHHNIIGDHAHIAPGVCMGGEVIVEEGCLIGVGATVMPRIKIGAWSVVGAGALVHSDVSAGSTVAGVPARPLGNC